MGHTLRLATRDDAPLLAALVRDAFRPVAEEFGFTPENWPRHASFTPPERILELMDDGHRYVILECGGAPCGCIAYRYVASDPSAPPDARPRVAGRPVEAATLHLRHLGVVPAWRGRGLGRALLEHAVAEGRRLGARQVTLGIAAVDLSLQHWYERRGFTLTETLPYDGMPCQVTWMALALY